MSKLSYKIFYLFVEHDIIVCESKKHVFEVYENIVCETRKMKCLTWGKYLWYLKKYVWNSKKCNVGLEFKLNLWVLSKTVMKIICGSQNINLSKLKNSWK